MTRSRCRDHSGQALDALSASDGGEGWTERSLGHPQVSPRGEGGMDAPAPDQQCTGTTNRPESAARDTDAR